MMVRRNVGWGVALCAEVEGDASDWRIQWEKAPDAAGAPDTANREVLEVLPEGELQLVDRSGIVFVGGPPWYRCRTVRGDCSTPGDWSDWVQVAPAALPERIPPCQPQGAGRTPTLDVVQTDRSLVVETYQATASPHPDSTAGAGGLELRYRERREGRGWGDWQPTGGDGWTSTNPVSIGVTRDRTRQKFLQIVARDTSLAGSPVSEARTVTIKSLQDQIDILGLGRGPLEDDRSRSGIGGHTPGGDRMMAPVRDAGDSVTMLDTVSRDFQEGTVQSSAFLASGLQQTDGARTGYLNKASELTNKSDGANGNSLNFQSAYQNEPQIVPLPGYLTSHSSLGATQYPDVRAVDVSPSGMTVQAVLKEPASAGTTQSVTFSTDTIAGVGNDDSDWSAEKTDAADPSDADNGEYTYFGTISATAFSTQFGCNSGSITIGLYTNDGSGWVQRSTVSESAQCASSSRDFEKTISVSGLGTRAGPEFAIGVEFEGGNGGTHSMDRVEWVNGSSPGGSQDATLTGDLPVQFAVHAKDDA